MKNWKIYVLRDPNDNTIRYVGYTGNSLETRLTGHINEAKYKTYKTHKLNWIRNLLMTNQLPIIELIEDSIHIDNIDEREIFYIDFFSSLNLTNATIGGRSCKVINMETRQKISKSLTGKEHSPETKKKMSISHLNKPFRNRKSYIKTEEHRQKISIANTGKKHTEATKQKLAELNIGKKLTDITKNKISEFQKTCDRSYQLGNSNAKGSVRSNEHKESVRKHHLGTKWIHDSDNNYKKIKAEDLDKWLVQGWALGRKCKS